MKTIGTVIIIGLVTLFSFEKKIERNDHFNLNTSVISTPTIKNDTIKQKLDSLEKDIQRVKKLEKELGIK